MSLIRRSILAISSLVASTVIWIVCLLGTIALSVWLDSPVSIPFVITHELGVAPTLTESSVQAPGLIIGILVLGAVIYMTARWLRPKRRQNRDSTPGEADTLSSGAAANGFS